MYMRQIGEFVNKKPAKNDDKPNPLKAGTESQGSSTAGQNVGLDLPKLLVTLRGRVLQEFEVKESKVLIGRARLNDLVVKNQCVSKYHGVLIFNNNTLFLVDLKSANGIYVNSHRVRSTILRHHDVIEIGKHRIKVFHQSSHARIAYVEPDPADTSILKTVAHMRRVIADKILRIAPASRRKSN